MVHLEQTCSYLTGTHWWSRGFIRMAQLSVYGFAHSEAATFSPCFSRKPTQSGWKMNFLWLLLPFGLLSPATSTCPAPCVCALDTTDCSDQDLTVNNIPTDFRPSTTTLYLSYNELTSIPNGLFDQMKGLQRVHLQGNPWDCDCRILYLRSWLQWQQNRSLYRDVVCRSPDHLQGRIISYLTEDEIVATCQSWYCHVAFIVQICLFTFILAQAVLFVLIILLLRRFYRLAKEGKATYNEIYENVDTPND